MRADERKGVGAALRFVLMTLLTSLGVWVVGDGLALGAPPSNRTVRWQVSRTYNLVRTHPDSAIAGLKKLLSLYPSHRSLILSRLGDAYLQVGKPDSAMATYEACLRFLPMDPFAAEALGKLYLDGGMGARADSLFRELKAKSTNKKSAYEAAGRAYKAVGMYPRALENYKEGRVALGDTAAFALEIGDLERMVGNPEGALGEYIRYAASPHAGSSVLRSRILELIRSHPEQADAMLAKLTRAATAGTLQFRLKLLGLLSRTYAEMGLLEKALETALVADRASAAGSATIFSLAGLLRQKYGEAVGEEKTRLGSVLLRAYEAYLVRHPRDRRSPRARLELASLLVDLSDRRNAGGPGESPRLLDRALALYDQVLRDYPSTALAESALLGKANVLLAKKKDPTSALSLYTSARRWVREHLLQVEEGVIRANLALGEFDEARKVCEKLATSGDDDLVGVGRYYLGLLLFKEKKYDLAKDTLSALAEQAPHSSYANDAVEVAWIVAAGRRGSKEVLSRYAEFLVAEAGYDSAAAISALAAVVAADKSEPLRPRALRRLGDFYLAQGKVARAKVCFETHRRDYPDDPFLPDVYRSLARLYETWEGKKREALEVYEKILVSYPDYLFLDGVRRDVERLRTALAREGGKW